MSEINLKMKCPLCGHWNRIFPSFFPFGELSGKIWTRECDGADEPTSNELVDTIVPLFFSKAFLRFLKSRVEAQAGS